MSIYSEIAEQIANIDGALCVLNDVEIENHLMNVSFSYSFIKACSSIPALDGLLMSCLSLINDKPANYRALISERLSNIHDLTA